MFAVTIIGQALLRSIDEDFEILDELEPFSNLFVAFPTYDNSFPGSSHDTAESQYFRNFCYSFFHFLPFIFTPGATLTGSVITAPRNMLRAYLRWSLSLGFYPKLYPNAETFSVDLQYGSDRKAYKDELVRDITSRYGETFSRNADHVANVDNRANLWRIGAVIQREIQRETRHIRRRLSVDDCASMGKLILMASQSYVVFPGFLYDSYMRSNFANCIHRVALQGGCVDVWEFTILADLVPYEVFLQDTFLQETLSQ
ncbi:ORF0 [Artemisia virus B]|uniref:ORF0 n=1 Tax=Artemisia virus B TaxID=2812730 RepID=A0A894J602_9VIRU|nr:ORF0 [Artemisia virus B]